MTIYSHSRLSAYEKCPRQFYLRYRARIPVEEQEGIEAFLGTRVHDALERFYRDRMSGRLMSAEELVAFFDARWERKYHTGIAIVRQAYRPEDYRQVGRECVQRYYARHQPFSDITLALEERVVIDLDGEGKHRVQGFIDRLAVGADGHVKVHDYKTGLRLPAQAEMDKDRQLALYMMAVVQRWPDSPGVRLVWHFLRHDQEIRSTRTTADLKSLREQTVRLIDEIESKVEEADFPPRESRLCDWCLYQRLCPCRKHAVAVETLPANRFLAEPGVELVNRLAELEAKKSELRGQIASLDAEYDEVETALVVYAQRSSVEKVVGSSHEARITRHTRTILPRKGQEPEQYAALDQQLRSSSIWPSVSQMDTHRLLRIWTGDEDDPDKVRPMLAPFVREEPEDQVSLRKRKGAEPE